MSRVCVIFILVLAFASAVAPAKIAEQAKIAAENAPDKAPFVVRSGEHDLDRRLMFDRDLNVEHAAGEESDGAHVGFARRAVIDAARVGAALPDVVPRFDDHAGGAMLTLHVPDGTRLRRARTGTDIVLDPLGAALGALRTSQRLAIPPPEMISPASEAAETPSGDAKPAEATEPPVQQPLPASPLPSTAPASASTLSVHYAAGDETASLRFPWAAPVPAAVFRRSGALWVVFAAPAAADVSEIVLRGKDAVERVDQVPDPAATVLRVTTRRGLEPSIRRVGNDWIVDLKAEDASTELPIEVDAQPSAQPSRVVFEMSNPAEPFEVRDPEVGDRLIVVATREVGRGLAAENSMVDFHALASTQGLVIRPDRDGVIAHRLPTGIEVTGPEGLALSVAADRMRGTASGVPRLFDFTAWLGPETDSFLERRSELERAIAAATPSTRSRPRLALARFYFANLYAAETLGVLDAIERADPSFAADPALRAMKGAAYLMNGDREEAARELGRAALDDQSEAALWRGSLAMSRGDARTAAREFAKGMNLIGTYPKALRNRFAFEIAEALIRTGQADDANPLLRVVLNNDPSPGDRAMARFLEGVEAKQRGRLGQALEAWQEVAAASDRPTRARALEARTVALLELGKLSRLEAIKQLDGLRFAWRGDQFEFELLHELGALLIAEGDYRRGLDTLRQAVVNFPDHPGLAEIKQQMSAAFAEVFLGKDAERLSPIKALALYDEFKELMPAGEPGDTIARGLAARLVAVDLLDRADALLEDQVNHRAPGIDKARLATQLALVRLLDRRPEPALAALDVAAGDDLPPALVRQRLQLRARALIDLGRNDQALVALAADPSRDADRLRADIYWKNQNWQDAARIFARLVDASGAGGRLADEQARLVVNWAAALTLADDQAGLAALRVKFSAAMASSQYAETFRVIAGNGASEGAAGDPRERARRLAQIGDLEGFTAKLKQRARPDKLGAVN